MAADVIAFPQRRPPAAAPAALVRAARGSLTQDAFARLLDARLDRHVGSGHIRAWEAGVPVPPDVTRECQAITSTREPATATADRGDVSDGDTIMIPCRAYDGRITWVSLSRRTFLSGSLGTATLAAVASAPNPTSAGANVAQLRAETAAGLTPVEHLERLRRVLIDADNLHGSGAVIPAVQAQIQMIGQLRDNCRPGADQRALLTMQAKYAELAGWLHQDARNFGSAQHWLDRALAWAQGGGDRDLSAYVMVRKSQLAGDMTAAADAADLADIATVMSRPRSRLKATAAIFGAYGHALAGRREKCLRAIDRGHQLADNLDDDSVWATWLDHAYVDAQQARCLTALGDHAAAAAVFQRGIRRLPTSYRRDRGVYIAREALAYSRAREPEQAAAAGMHAIVIAQDTRSGRIADELAHVGDSLAAWTSVPAVADFRDALGVLTRRVN